MYDPPVPGDWRKELDEREAVTVAFAQRYRQSWDTVPVAGRHMILMIADLATRLDKTEALLNSVLARFNELNKPHNLVRRAAEVIFQMYRDQTVSTGVILIHSEPIVVSREIALPMFGLHRPESRNPSLQVEYF
jgi:hypothetical protein